MALAIEKPDALICDNTAHDPGPGLLPRIALADLYRRTRWPLAWPRTWAWRCTGTREVTFTSEPEEL